MAAGHAMRDVILPARAGAKILAARKRTPTAHSNARGTSGWMQTGTGQLSSMTTRPVPNHGAERRRDIATVALNLSQKTPCSSRHLCPLGFLGEG